MQFGNPVEGMRIVPYMEDRTLDDRLANGRPAFRITQTFDSPDFYYGDGRIHRALDLGNYHCGDKVLAVNDGIARPTKDNATRLGATSDALGVIIDHGSGWSSEVWHLNDTIGGVQTVKKGDVIGIVGRTGLGNVCHLHLELKFNTVRVDPLRYLESMRMFTDVENDNIHKAAIEWAARTGLIRGIGTGRYGPKQSVTREQLATILYRYNQHTAKQIHEATKSDG